MKTEWKQIAEITVEPLRYVALKTDSGTFRMQIFNGESLMSDRMYRGKYAHKAADDGLHGLPVRFRWEPRNTDGISGGYQLDHSYGNYSYSFAGKLTPMQRLEKERSDLIERLGAIATELEELGYNKKPPKLTFDELCDCM